MFVELRLNRFKLLCGTVYSTPKGGYWYDVEEAFLKCSGSYDYAILMSDFKIIWHIDCCNSRTLSEFLNNYKFHRLRFGTTYHLDNSDTAIGYICVSDLSKVNLFEQKHVPNISKHDFLFASFRSLQGTMH